MDLDALSADLPPPDRGAWSEITGSLFAHLAVLALSALLIPPLGDVKLDEALDQPRYLSFPFQDTAADPDEAEPLATTLARGDPDEEEPAESRCGEARGGSMGHPEAATAARRYGVQGPIDNPDPHLALAALGGEISFTPLLFTRPATSWGGDLRAPTAPWGRDDSLGNDPRSARGHLWGSDIGEALGSPGTGVGLTALCDACGASGRGASLHGTAPGGPTGTELSFQVARTQPLAR